MDQLSDLRLNHEQPLFFQLIPLFLRDKGRRGFNHIHTLAFIIWGTGWLLLERFERGERWLWRAWKWNPKHPEALALLGIHFAQCQKHKKAYLVWRLFGKKYQKDKELFLTTMRVQNQIGLQQKSIEALLNQLKTTPNTASRLPIVQVLAEAYFHNKSYQKAFEVYRSEVEGKKYGQRIQQQLVTYAYHALRYDYGDQLLQQLDNGSRNAKLFTIKCLNFKNENEALEAALDHLLHQEPDNKFLLWNKYTYCFHLYEKGKKKRHLEELQALLTLLKSKANRYEPRLLNESIRLAILSGANEKAIQLIQQLPNNRSKLVLKFKMWAAYHQGNFKREKELWQLFKKLYYIPQIQPVEEGILSLIAGNPKMPPQHQILLFTCIKNEIDRLSWFLDYYRNLGVTHFFIIDNQSNDGTKEFLSAQADVVLFWTAEKYARGYSGIKWINHLVKRYAHHNWVLYVDVDEALVYAQSETIKLPDFTQSLEQQGYQALHAPMLDMFDLQENHSSRSGNYLLDYPYYLNDRSSTGAIRPPYVSDFGGIRAYLGVYESHTKVPLIKGGRGIQFLNSSHNISPCSLLLSGGVLLHYRLVDDFVEKTRLELQEKNRVTACMARLKSYNDRVQQLDFSAIKRLPTFRKYAHSQNLINEKIIQELEHPA